MRIAPWIVLVTGLSIPMAALAAIGEIDVNVPTTEKPAPIAKEDHSVLWIRSGTRIYLMVTDSKGRKTGVEWQTRKTLQNIPNSTCEADFLENQYTHETDELQESMTLEPAAKGRYVFHLRGLKPGPYTVSLSALSQSGSSLPSKDIEGLISEGEEKTVTLNFQPDERNSLAVVEEAPRRRSKSPL